MKTPVDPVIRIEKRSVEGLKIRIAAHMEDHLGLVEAEQRINIDIAEQYRNAAADWALAAHAYGRRKLAERARLSSQRRNIEVELDRLRVDAADAFGRLRAAEEVAGMHRQDARLAQDRADQAEADDFAGRRFTARKRTQDDVRWA
jgi:hypothetical protein